MLADLTGKNPNVFYELGLAHAARKPVLLVTQSMDDVPFDLRALRVIVYDVEHPAWGQVLREAIVTGLQETLESPERSVLPTFLLEEPADQPTVSQDERRLLELQQQIDSLRAEMRDRTSDMDPSSAPQIRPAEAEAMLRGYVEHGMPDRVIVNRLVKRGVPRDWIKRELAQLRSNRMSLSGGAEITTK